MRSFQFVNAARSTVKRTSQAPRHRSRSIPRADGDSNCFPGSAGQTAMGPPARRARQRLFRKSKSRIWRCCAGCKPIFGRSHRLGEREPRCTQQEKKFAGPEQNIQQSSALKIGQRFGMQADIEGLSGTFFDEVSHIGQIRRLHLKLAAARIERLKICVTPRQKVIQTKSLLIQ
jgi:hypothetical protein